MVFAEANLREYGERSFLSSIAFHFPQQCHSEIPRVWGPVSDSIAHGASGTKNLLLGICD